MAKYFLATIVFFLAGMLLMPPTASAAFNELTFDANFYVYLWGIPLTLTVSAGGAVESMTVNSGNVVFEMDLGSSVTIISNDRRTLTNTLGAGTVCAETYSQVTLTATADNQTVTVTPTDTCGGGGGGGGGGAAPPTDTTSPSISDITALVNSTSTTISWTTSEPSLSWVVCGTSTSYGLEEKDSSYKTSHSLTLANLSSSTVYHYQVKSQDSTGNVGSYTDKTFTTLAQKELVVGEAAVSTSTGGTAKATTDQGTTASLEMPASAVTAESQLTITPTQTTAESVVTEVAAVPSEQSIVGSYVYSFTVESAGETVSIFEQEVTVTLTYTDAQVSGLNEASLTIYYYDESLSQWLALTSTVDAENNTVSATTAHFTIFALMGEEEEEEEVITKPISEMTIAELKAEIARIAALIAQLQVQLVEVFGGGAIEGIPAGFSFEKNLQFGMVDNDIKYLQIVLNSAADTSLADEGVGSPGHETNYFGSLTKVAVIKFQEKYTQDTLTPWGLTQGTGFAGATTREKLNELLSESYCLIKSLTLSLQAARGK